MDCKISGEQIIDFHFGNLSEAKRSSVELHLAQCPDCLTEFFALKRDLEVPTATLPSAGTVHRIKSEFESFCLGIWSEESRLWVHTHRRKILLGGLLAAVATLLLVFSSQNHLLKQRETRLESDKESVQSLDETIDSGRSSPIHINTI